MNAKKTSLTLAIGAAFAATAGLAPVAHAADNPFAMQKLDAGYQLAAKHMAAPADEKMKDGKCGGDKAKDGKCGGDKAKADGKKKDGKCGEGKCGGKKDAGAKADDKKKDGKCGEGKCGGKK